MEDRLAPATTLSIADASVLEPAAGGTVNMDFTVTRTGDLSSALAVSYTTVAGTAQPGTDFTPQTGTTTFAAGSATATISIPVFGNGVHNNSSLTFSVKLTGIGPPVMFADAQTFATGQLSYAVAVGDFNGDRKPDLAVANLRDQTVSVLVNTTPTGATTPSFVNHTFAVSDPFSVVVADFNGDGKPDLALSNIGEGTVSVLINTTPAGATTPTFAAPRTFATGGSPQGVAVADFNGDGKPDLVVCNAGDGTVSVLVNTTPTGASIPSFAPQKTFAVNANSAVPRTVVTADVNGDGKPDVIVVNLGYSVAVLLNTTPTGATTPSFAPPQQFAPSASFVAVGDINGDGRPDLVVRDSNLLTVSALLNTTPTGATTASFGAPQTLAAIGGPIVLSKAVADVNGDGKPDVVAGYTSPSGDIVSVLLNNTAPGASVCNFAAPQIFTTPQAFPSAMHVAIADVNNDGQPDLIAACTIDGSVAVLLNAPGIIARGTAMGTITQAPNPTVTQFAISNTSVTSLTAGGTLTFMVTAEDSSGAAVPGYAGTVQLTNSDGRATLGGMALPATYNFVPNDSGTHTFTVTLATAGVQTVAVTDQANKSITATTNPITVNAGSFSQFVVSAPGGNTLTAGQPFLITAQAADAFDNPVTNYSGPTSVTVAASPPDPQAISPISGTLNGGGFGYFLGDLKTAGYYTLTATAGSSSGTSALLAVTPSDASYFTLTAPAAATTGSSFNIKVQAFDHFGNLATGYGGQVRLTSSDTTALLPANSTLTHGVGSFNVTLNAAGSQTITATDSVSTNPTITGTSSAITSRGLTVTSFAPLVNGFTAIFSKPFVPADVTLYGPAASTVQDVTLVGANTGPISGTLIMSATDTHITFQATASALTSAGGAPILPDDTYTATIVSGPGTGGFHDALNAALDGTNNAGHANYTTTFTTHYRAAAAPILTMPDFARGPDDSDPIQVPNDTAHGIPITLYNASNVTDVVFDLNYDSTLIDISGASSGDATDPGSSLKLLNAHAFGFDDAYLEYQSAVPQSGTIVLGDIMATVPNSAAANYKAKELLQLVPDTINGVQVSQALGGSAVHVNAYLGDVTGNGSIDALDVATAATVAQGRATGFAAFGLLDPAIIGDPANDISVDAGDVSTLAAFTAHLSTPTIPVIPAGLTITPVGADPTLSLGAHGRQGNQENVGPGESDVSPVPVSLSPGLSFSVPVLLDSPHPKGSTGMTEAVLALTYDPAVLSVSPADITLGTLPSLSTGWQLTAVVDPMRGGIGITIYSTTPITQAQAGSLVNIVFHISGAPSGVSRRRAVPVVQLVDRVTVGGQEFITQVDDDQGQLVITSRLGYLAAKTSRRQRLGRV